MNDLISFIVAIKRGPRVLATHMIYARDSKQAGEKAIEHYKQQGGTEVPTSTHATPLLRGKNVPKNLQR